MKRYGAEGFKPGDVIITNHQAVAGQHLNNVVIYMPYFYKGELLMFSMVRAHWIDVGGTSTGFGAGAAGGRSRGSKACSSTSSRSTSEGELDETLYRVIKDNIRFPESSLGDMKSQMAACRLAARRMDELFDKYGRDTMLAAIRHDLRRNRTEVPQRGGAASRRRLRGVRLDRRRRRAQGRAGADPRQGDRQGLVDDHRPVGLLAGAQGRHQFAHARRRARRLQGADRAARSGQRGLVPRARGRSSPRATS